MGPKRVSAVTRDKSIGSLVRRHIRGLLVLFVVVLCVHDIFGPHGFLAMRRTQNEIKKVKADIEQLNKENADLAQVVKDLKTDPYAIEKIAREDLILAKPGEIIIKIPQSQQHR
ncbi:MAG TPA: septum formation initiator family protein [Candidatus Dormibacteraeota bacterium]|nr:septum formation initiator family protein [Candidatus Dormibacteraeota bacterium]